MAHGRYSYIAIGKEDTHGQASTSINTFLRFASGGFSLEKENIESKALTGKLLKTDVAIGTRYWTGKLTGAEIDAVDQGLMFKSLLGSETIEPDGSKYKHIFKVNTDPDAYTSLTFEQYKTEWLRHFLGGRVIGMTLKGELNAIMVADYDVIATDFTELDPTNKKAPTFNGQAFRFYESSFLVNSIALPVKSFEVSIKENAEADFNFLGGKKPTGLLRGSLEGSVKFTLNLSETSLEYWSKMLNENDVSITIQMQKTNGDKITITIPRVRITNYSENDGDELLKSDIEGVILSATNEADSVKIELTNSKDTEY